MATWNSPAVARRWLAHELRTRREALGLSQSAVGKACGWSGVKVSYIENAQQKSITDDDLDKLLPVLEVPTADRPAFSDAATATREKGWWERYGDDVVPTYLSEFIGLERGASLIRSFEPLIIPGLLQTPPYMEAVIAADGTPRSRRLFGQVAEVRLKRQQILWREEGATSLVTVVDESVLRRIVGGPSVMAEQLEHVIEVCDNPNVQLYVIPFAHGVSPGMVTSSYRILHFPAGIPPIVYLEGRADAQWVEGAAVDMFDQAFEEVQDAALNKADSLAMVEEVKLEFSGRVRRSSP